MDAREHRAGNDWVAEVGRLLTLGHPDAENAETIALVVDNLNTDTLGALHETFAPGRTHVQARCLKNHCTSRHGS